MFCRYCGNDIAGDSVFCEVCGKRLKEETVAPAPVFEEPVQYDTNSPLYYYNNPTAQTNPSTSREYHASKYERMSGFSGSLPNEPHEPSQKIEYKRAPDEPIKPKKKKGKGKLPYILLPVAGIVSSIISTIFQLIGVNVYSAIVHECFIDSDFSYSFLYWSIYSLVSGLTGVIPYVIAIVLFSLCCKGIYKKAMFVGSIYTGQIGGILASFFSVIVGYIILFTKGFYTYESQSIYTAVISFSNIISLIICTLVALLFFLWSQKYTVRKEEKTRPVKLVVPCILLAVYGVLSLGLEMLANLVLQPAFDELFNGDYTYNFASNVAHLITTSISLVCLFLMALACKGGYRKVAFIGSFKFAIPICAFFMNFITVIGTLINDDWYTGAVYVGQVIQYICAIPVAIIIYILLNRYTVEKIKKRA